MDEKRWFVLSDGNVQGPLTGEEVDLGLEDKRFKEPLFWWRGQSEWVPTGEWKKERKAYQEYLQQQLEKANQRLWKIRQGETELPAMSQKEMLDFLKKQAKLSDIRIWTEGYQEWRDVFQIHSIMDELGVSRRQHPRVPIKGEYTFESMTGLHTSPLKTISQGGLGILGGRELEIGQTIKGTITSAQLSIPIHVSCEVVYQSGSGHIGLKFNNLGPDAKASIIEYVRKFSEEAKEE